MDETKILNNMVLEFELIHIPSNTVFGLGTDAESLRIGKPNDLLVPEIDLSAFPNNEIVSRQHGEIRINNGNYYLVDQHSSNGTYLNGEKLESGNLYQLTAGDRINFGLSDDFAFVFQAKASPVPNPSPPIAASPPSSPLQTQALGNVARPSINRPSLNSQSKPIGLALIAIAVVIIAINTQIGIFLRIPGLLLCAAGAILQFQNRINKNIGWVLIAIGILIILTGNVFASVNLLAIIIASGLLFAGYQLVTIGKIFNYSPEDIRDRVKGVLKGKK